MSCRSRQKRKNKTQPSDRQDRLFGNLRPSSILQHLLHTGGRGGYRQGPYSSSLYAEEMAPAENDKEMVDRLDTIESNESEDDVAFSEISSPSYYYYYYYDESGIDISNEIP